MGKIVGSANVNGEAEHIPDEIGNAVNVNPPWVKVKVPKGKRHFSRQANSEHEGNGAAPFPPSLEQDARRSRAVVSRNGHSQNGHSRNNHSSASRVSRFRGYFREGGIDVPAQDDMLTRKDVDFILADQHGNRKEGITPRYMCRRWVSSREFMLMEIPLWAVNPYKFIEEDDPTYSEGPLIIDVNKRKPRPLLGSFGASPSLFILDGKHRYYELRRAGETHVQAYVGDLAVPILDDLVERFGPLREAFGEAVRDFYADPSPVTQAYLIKSAEDAGLSEAQTYQLIDNFYHGWVFDLASGEFQKSDDVTKIPS